MRVLPAFVALLALTTGCDAIDSVLNPAPPEACITIEKLPGTTWVMDQAMPEGPNFANPQARMTFEKAGDTYKAKYSVLSLSAVYDYTCVVKDDELECKEDADYAAWCQALEVHEEGSCTAKTLRDFGATGGDAKLKKAVAKGKKVVAEMKADEEKWPRFKATQNYLGNKLQGSIYVKPNDTKCNVRVSDMYMTIVNGKKHEDSNPVGTNPFVRSEEAWRWVSCDRMGLHGFKDTAEMPEQVAPLDARPVSIGDKIDWYYYGPDAVEVEEGCTYSADTYGQFRPLGKDVAIEATEGKLNWHVQQSFGEKDAPNITNATPPGSGLFTMTRYKTCGGEKSTIDTVCGLVKVF